MSKGMKEFAVVILVLVVLVLIMLPLVGAARDSAQKSMAEEEGVAKIDDRFDIISSQVIDYKTIHILRDKKTNEEYFLVASNNAVAFGPFLKKEER